MHGLSRPESRAEAVRWAADPCRALTIEPDHECGMREWLALLDGELERAFVWGKLLRGLHATGDVAA